MAEQHTHVIVGASLAGAKAAETLREEGFDGRIVLVGDEHEPPYERPPLSKGLLLGREERSKVFVHEDSWYQDKAIDLRRGERVTRLDRVARTVELEGGEAVRFDKVLLATGASPRHIPIDGAELEGVRYLRRLTDSEQLKSELASSPRVVVIGAGWIEIGRAHV